MPWKWCTGGGFTDQMKEDARSVVITIRTSVEKITTTAPTAVQRWMVMGMVDCVGKELKIGDKVICSDMNYADLLLGEVIGFTPKKIRVKYHRSIDGFDFRKDQLKHPYQVFKYEEVVRCKDCKHYHTHNRSVKWNTESMYCCKSALKKVCPNDFCSYGERR